LNVENTNAAPLFWRTALKAFRENHSCPYDDANSINFSKIFYEFLGLVSVPDASAVVADLTASSIADISAAISDLPDAVAYTAVSP
jgi:hypothetical protein